MSEQSKEKQPTFEEKLADLETIVNQLEQGDVPLESALDQFQKGVNLSKDLQKTLENADQTLAKLMSDDGKEVAFEKPAGDESHD
ncbi:exodeoxyribonuclease VII small subunit [Secundilactobacillus malefermentans]|uniref:Exodeoxyribonuclease 7 small subunit n=1 Tax=Secundilactobacillus malefermentans TaxID=176292 RepID=A0A4R5NTA3_9LACO|nr:exodeoxyribonuclease VII small subunit [Secundilactobacillus malefermentans]KRM59628.1 exodeoxyribonuclease VII small subunit [Secundilactobacillus malefermentans DSM 5705 = KCTC 3548]QEA32461.1 exodeoxyribonuclease VII small subunit [Secundilactobacillus malefermentans]TDG80417.1 hypothetical protein C5L31_000783 [Secundilactobacillus malefermentans]